MWESIRKLFRKKHNVQSEIKVKGFELDWDTYCFIFFLLEKHGIDCKTYDEMISEDHPKAKELRRKILFKFKHKTYYDVTMSLIRFHDYDLKRMKGLYEKRMFDKFWNHHSEDCSVQFFKEDETVAEKTDYDNEIT